PGSRGGALGIGKGRGGENPTGRPLAQEPSRSPFASPFASRALGSARGCADVRLRRVGATSYDGAADD
ncbi:hypothetical protein, partial [Streptomyces sp. NPDC059455]|uniref:hypothetical protein n=1 Tax=Streptomyces sp. NPDC059455 TaxID=3346837 RepID=UPI003688A06D